MFTQFFNPKPHLLLWTLLASLGLFSWNNLQAQPGNALRLDGTGDFVTISSSGQNNITGTAITLEAWIYPTSWKTNYYDGSIVVKEGHFAGYILSCGNSGQLSFNIPDGGNHNTLNSSTGVLSLNKWQHVAATYDGTTMRLFVNGVQVGTRGSSSAIVTTANSLMIGASAHAANREFAGRIDEVRIWNSTRTPDQILDGMHRELAGSESGLAAYYKMSNGSGSTLTDNVSSGGTNGTITNAVWMASTARLTTESNALKYRASGTGLDFDGTNDYVAIADANALDLTKNFTLEAWVNPASLGAGFGRILGKDGAYGLGLNNTTIRFSTYGVQDYDLTYTVPTSQWTHIAVVMNSTDDALFYVNGILRGTVDGAASAEISGSALWVGASSNGGGEQYFTGKIDEVRIWNTPRTATQIQDNMLRVVDPASANLVATYRFDEVTGTTLSDATANGLNGTLTNMDATDWVSAADREPLKVWRASSTWLVDSAWVFGSAPSTSVTNQEWVEVTVNMGLSTGAACYAGNVNVPSGISFSNSGSQALNINGSLVNNGTMSSTLGQVRFQDSTQQAVLTGSGTFSQGQLYVEAPYGLLMEQNVTIRTLHVQSATGNLYINGRTLTISTNGAINGTSIVGGATSNLSLINSGSEVFVPGMTLNNLTLNKANGMRLVDNVRVEGVLAINSGRIDLNLKNLTLGPDATISTSSSFGTGRMIVATSGRVIKEMEGVSTFLLPIGDAFPNYTPIQLEFRSGTFDPGANVSVQLYNSTHPNNTSGNHRLDRYWRVEGTGISNFTCRVDAWYADMDIAGDIADETMLKSSKWDGSAWLILGGVDDVDNRIAGQVNGFSDFTAGEEEVFAALPVELLSFTAEPRADVVNLNWTTLNEQNSEFFQVQRSENGEKFETIGQLAAAGNSTTVRDYAFTDGSPLDGTAYYRLRQTDIDGQVHFSNTVEVNLRGSGIELFPNPASDGFWVSVPEDIVGSLFITTAMGKLVKSVRIDGGKQYVDVSNLPSGVYYGAFKLRGMKGSVEKIVIK